MAQKTNARLPTIGAVIRAWRLSHGFSETELADKAGVRLGYVSEIENDKKTRPQEEYLEKLADALGVPLEDILGRRMPRVDGEAQSIPSSQQAGAEQESQQATSSRTVFRSPLAPSDRQILMRRLAIMEQRLEAAEEMLEAAAKNLQDARKEHREFAALAEEMFSLEGEP